MCDKKECEACGDNVYDCLYNVVFTDGQKTEACNICLIEFFKEIPAEISKVEAI